MSNLLAKVSSSISHHFTELEDLASIIFTSFRILLEHARHSIVGHQIVANKLLAEIRECNWVLDEDGVLLRFAHQRSLVSERQFVNFDRTPGFNFANMSARRRVGSEKTAKQLFSNQQNVFFYIYGVSAADCSRSLLLLQTNAGSLEMLIYSPAWVVFLELMGWNLLLL